MATGLEKWQSLTQDPRAVGFFTGLFDRVGVRVTDTKEGFTCVHKGNCIDFEPTLDESKVDYVVEIDSFQVDQMSAYAEKGEFSTAEKYRITRALFTPATAATLKNPVLSNNVLRELSGVEDLIHVHLQSPTPNEPDCEDASHTLIYVDNHWLVIPGLQGEPKRTFRLTLDEALAYHKKVFAAMKANKLNKWISFRNWYVKWRPTVSTQA